MESIVSLCAPQLKNQMSQQKSLTPSPSNASSTCGKCVICRSEPGSTSSYKVPRPLATPPSPRPSCFSCKPNSCLPARCSPPRCPLPSYLLPRPPSPLFCPPPPCCPSPRCLSPPCCPPPMCPSPMCPPLGKPPPSPLCCSPVCCSPKCPPQCPPQCPCCNSKICCTPCPCCCQCTCCVCPCHKDSCKPCCQVKPAGKKPKKKSESVKVNCTCCSQKHSKPAKDPKPQKYVKKKSNDCVKASLCLEMSSPPREKCPPKKVYMVCDDQECKCVENGSTVKYTCTCSS